MRSGDEGELSIAKHHEELSVLEELCQRCERYGQEQCALCPVEVRRQRVIVAVMRDDFNRKQRDLVRLEA